jgi:hypothetical protein
MSNLIKVIQKQRNKTTGLYTNYIARNKPALEHITFRNLIVRDLKENDIKEEEIQPVLNEFAAIHHKCNVDRLDKFLDDCALPFSMQHMMWRCFENAYISLSAKQNESKETSIAPSVEKPTDDVCIFQA